MPLARYITATALAVIGTAVGMLAIAFSILAATDHYADVQLRVGSVVVTNAGQLIGEAAYSALLIGAGLAVGAYLAKVTSR